MCKCVYPCRFYKFYFYFQDVWYGVRETVSTRHAEDLGGGGTEDMCCGGHQHSDGGTGHDTKL